MPTVLPDSDAGVWAGQADSTQTDLDLAIGELEVHLPTATGGGSSTPQPATCASIYCC